MKPLDDHQITISKFNMHLPSLNQSNIAISVISWTTNPYISNQTIDTNVVSISLSNLSGSVLDTTQLSNPIQLKMDLKKHWQQVILVSKIRIQIKWELPNFSVD